MPEECSQKSESVLATGYTRPRRILVGSFLAIAFSDGANRHKLITSFTQTKVVTTNFKATRPQKLSPLVTTALLGVNRHFQLEH